MAAGVKQQKNDVSLVTSVLYLRHTHTHVATMSIHQSGPFTFSVVLVKYNVFVLFTSRQPLITGSLFNLTGEREKTLSRTNMLLGLIRYFPAGGATGGKQSVWRQEGGKEGKLRDGNKNYRI